MKAVELWCAVLGLLCWPICFVWMYRISARQEELLQQLHAQGKRIEDVSKTEHELIKKVHPKVEEIHDSIKEVTNAISSNPSINTG
jgi:hypothetical protein